MASLGVDPHYLPHKKKPADPGTSVDGGTWPKDARKPCNQEVEVSNKNISETSQEFTGKCLTPAQLSICSSFSRELAILAAHECSSAPIKCGTKDWNRKKMNICIWKLVVNRHPFQQYVHQPNWILPSSFGTKIYKFIFKPAPTPLKINMEPKNHLN